MSMRNLARPLLASWFVYAGIESIVNPHDRAERSAPVVEPLLEEAGVTTPLPTLVQAHGVATVAAAAALAASKSPRLAGTALAGLTALTVIAGRPFWLEEDEYEREAEREQFVKNVSLLGAAMLAASVGNSRRRRKKRRR